jgi:hypothetical protein
MSSSAPDGGHGRARGLAPAGRRDELWPGHGAGPAWRTLARSGAARYNRAERRTGTASSGWAGRRVGATICGWAGARGRRGELQQEPHGAVCGQVQNCGDYERSKKGNEYDMWVQIVSEGSPLSRPGLQYSRCAKTGLGFEIDRKS